MPVGAKLFYAILYPAERRRIFGRALQTAFSLPCTNGKGCYNPVSRVIIDMI